MNLGNASEDTKRTYCSYVKQFLLWCDREEIYPARVKSTEIIAYRSYLVSEGKSTNTIALTLVALRHFYKGNIDLVTENPVVKIKPPKPIFLTRNAIIIDKKLTESMFDPGVKSLL